MSSEKRAGIRYALLAYGAWGLFPLYWKLLQNVSPSVILFHRILWSWVFYTILRSWIDRRLEPGWPISRAKLKPLLASSVLIASNWFLYIWAVNSGHIVETSLGYFINPLVNVLLGVVLLKERLHRDQVIAVGLAVAGVLLLTYEMGRLPWIAMGLALTFSLYGFVRKRAAIGSIEGGQIEGLLMVAPVLLFLGVGGHDPFVAAPSDWLFLIGAGIVTGAPLIWFVEAGKRLPYSVLGFFQYLAPTLQFLTGVFVFHETVTNLKLVGFSLIWAGLVWLMSRSAWSYARARGNIAVPR